MSEETIEEQEVEEKEPEVTEAPVEKPEQEVDELASIRSDLAQLAGIIERFAPGDAEIRATLEAIKSRN